MSPKQPAIQAHIKRPKVDPDGLENVINDYFQTFKKSCKFYSEHLYTHYLDSRINILLYLLYHMSTHCYQFFKKLNIQELSLKKHQEMAKAQEESLQP